MGQRSPGPLVWLDNTVLNGRPFDRADYHDHEINDRRRENVNLRTKPGDSPASSLFFDLDNNSSRATAATVSAYGALDDPTFSIFAHVTGDMLYFNQNKYIPVFYKHTSNANIYSKHEFQSHIMCRTYSACSLYIMAPDSSRTLRTYQTAFLIDSNGARIAISYDGNIPRIAIDGDMRTLTPVTSSQPYNHTGQAAPSGAYAFRFGMFDNENALTSLTYREARIYARPLADVELEALGRTCNRLDCSEQNQNCFETFGAYNGTATCTTCRHTAYDSLSYESQGGICDAKSEAFEECAGDVECQDGVCLQSYSNSSNPGSSRKYYCASNYRSSACTQTCGALNRSCETVYGRLLSNTNVTGGGYTCGITMEGAIMCWGQDTAGEVSMAPMGRGFSTISTSPGMACALAQAGNIQCWGQDGEGKVSGAPMGMNFQDISVGGSAACAIAQDGSLMCWGDDVDGVLSNQPMGGGYRDVAVGAAHACAIAQDGGVECWGDNSSGQLDMLPMDKDFIQVGARGAFTCGLRTGGAIACWGADIAQVVSSTPSDTGYTKLSVGNDAVCAIHPTNGLSCWGSDSFGLISNAP